MIVLPARLDSCSRARALLKSALRGHDLSDHDTDDVLLVLSELLGNALRHGRPLTEGGRRGIGVEWTVGPRTVEVRVTDGGTGRLDNHAAPLDAEGGRGLGIVEALSAEWGVDRFAARTSVWARIDRGAPAVNGREASPGGLLLHSAVDLTWSGHSPGSAPSLCQP